MKEVLNFVVKHLSYSEYCNFFGTCQSKKPDMWAHTPQNPNINQLYIFKFIFWSYLFRRETGLFNSVLEILWHNFVLLYSYIHQDWALKIHSTAGFLKCSCLPVILKKSPQHLPSEYSTWWHPELFELLPAQTPTNLLPFSLATGSGEQKANPASHLYEWWWNQPGFPETCWRPINKTSVRERNTVLKIKIFKGEGGLQSEFQDDFVIKVSWMNDFSDYTALEKKIRQDV